jgi:hypothetical protein
MRPKVIGYWVTTTVIASELLVGGLTDLVHGGTMLVAGQPVAGILTHLGYPAYVLTILGVWKLPGGVVLRNGPCIPRSFAGGCMAPTRQIARFMLYCTHA